MQYSIVYSSQTGNTIQLAKQIQKELNSDLLIYSGHPSEEALDADLIFVGFWTEKGSCDPFVSSFLQQIRHKKVFLFGTAGFSGSVEYFSQILSRVTANLDGTNTIVGQYMCQGKMPDSVRKQYESMLKKDPETMEPLLENFHIASTHPDQNDMDGLVHTVKNLLIALDF